MTSDASITAHRNGTHLTSKGDHQFPSNDFDDAYVDSRRHLEPSGIIHCAQDEPDNRRHDECRYDTP
jgi:hypothetical protein